MSVVLGLVLADLHLSLKPPLARSVEEDWLFVQQRQLAEVRRLQKKHGAPLLLCGDVFDKFNPPPELINFAIEHLPPCYAVAGNHDIEHQSLRSLRRSAFWTLVEAKIITLLDYRKPTSLGRLRLHGFSWGVDIKPLAKPHDLMLEVAVIHQFVWSKGTGHEGASEQAYFSAHQNKLQGYDVSFWGDNHLPFTERLGTHVLCNVGGFLRRRSDERGHRPSVALLYDDGSVGRHYLDVSPDRFAEEESPASAGILHADGFLQELAALGDAGIDFRAAVERVLQGTEVRPGVRDVVLQALAREKQ